MNKKRPVPAPEPASNSNYPKPAGPTTERKMPKPGFQGRPKLWAFSFRFWEQKDFFGLPTRYQWFVSLLNRLKELSRMPVEEREKPIDEIRYHEIDWQAKNIPVQRNEFAWIEADYLKNAIEFPFLQFHISKSTGRVIGFWDENAVFNIILLDEMHNMQPSNYVQYRVRDTWAQRCDYTSVLHDVDRVRATQCSAPECPTNVAVRKLPSSTHDHEVLIIPFPEGTIAAAEELIREGKASSMAHIFEHGVFGLMYEERSKE
jgi:hypothetical protein